MLFVFFVKFVVVIKMNMPSFKAKHAVLRPAKPAFAPLNMPFSKPEIPCIPRPHWLCGHFCSGRAFWV